MRKPLNMPNLSKSSMRVSSQRGEQIDRGVPLAPPLGSVPPSLHGTRLTEVEHDAIWVANVATREGSILFLDRAAGSDEAGFRDINIRHQEFEHWTVLGASLDVEAEGTCFESQHRIAAVCDRQAKN